MTFFANSGIAWPSLEQATTEAGQKSLEAAAELWAALASLEGRNRFEFPTFTTGHFEAPAQKFLAAAKLYKNISEQVDVRYLQPLSPAEMDVAAIEDPWRYDRWEEKFWRHDRPVNRKLLYNDLAIRLETLASRLFSFSTAGEKGTIAPQIFQLMQSWESLATLGRIIAVINRRETRD